VDPRQHLADGSGDRGLGATVAQVLLPQAIVVGGSQLMTSTPSPGCWPSTSGVQPGAASPATLIQRAS
jgi:hypothetical protein